MNATPDADPRVALHGLPVATLLLREQRIVAANPAARRLLGAAEAALIGRSLLALFDPDALQRWRARDAALAPGAAETAPTDERVLGAEGALREVQTLASRLDDGRIVLMLHDVGALRASQASLRRSQDELRRVAAGADDRRDAEQRRLARAVHDELQQTLAAIRLEIGAVGERAAGAAAEAAIERIGDLALAALASTRRIVDGLSPPMLDDLGLVPALEALALQSVRRSGTPCRFDALPAAARAADALAPAAATCLYRVAQEALLNASRHAQAGAVQLRLGIDGAALVLSVTDDGRGIDDDELAKTGTSGLAGLRERLRRWGGALRVVGVPGQGTTVEARLDPARPAPAETAEAAGPADDEAFSTLLRFLYRAPVGLVQAAPDGRIEMLNPMAAQLLMPFAPAGRLDDLFAVLEAAAPTLRAQAAAAQGGVVCEALRLVPARGPVVTLALLQYDGPRLMAVLARAPE